MALIALHGLTIPDEAIVLGCELERRGYTFSRQRDRLMLNRTKKADSCPDTADTLSDHDRAQIQKWKHHLLAVVDLIEATTDR